MLKLSSKQFTRNKVYSWYANYTLESSEQISVAPSTGVVGLMSSFMKSGQKVPKLFIYIYESGPNSIRIIIFILIVSGNVALTKKMKYDSMYSHPQK